MWKCSVSPGSLVEKPVAALSLVDPDLDQAGGSDIVMFLAHYVGST